VRDTVCECGQGFPPGYSPPELAGLAPENGQQPYTPLEQRYMRPQAPETAQLLYAQEQQLKAAQHEKLQLLQAFQQLLDPLLQYCRSQGFADVSAQNVVPLVLKLLQSELPQPKSQPGTPTQLYQDTYAVLARLADVLEVMARSLAAPALPVALSMPPAGPLPGFVHTDQGIARLERELAHGARGAIPGSELPDERYAR